MVNYMYIKIMIHRNPHENMSESLNCFLSCWLWLICITFFIQTSLTQIKAEKPADSNPPIIFRQGHRIVDHYVIYFVCTLVMETHSSRGQPCHKCQLCESIYPVRFGCCVKLPAGVKCCLLKREG